MSQRDDLVICGVVRTPFSFGNKLAGWRAEKLLAAVLAELPKRYNLPLGKIDLVVSGAVQQDTKAPNTARIASLIAGYPDVLNAYMVQSNCNSSLMALEAVMGSILLGDAEVGIAAGVESMSNFGFRLEDRARTCANRAEVEQKLRAGAEGFLQDFGVVHCLEEGLKDSLHDIAMIEVAELMAQVYGVSREEQDNFARRQLERAVAAVEGKKLHRYLLRQLSSGQFRQIRRDLILEGVGYTLHFAHSSKLGLVILKHPLNSGKDSLLCCFSHPHAFALRLFKGYNRRVQKMLLQGRRRLSQFRLRDRHNLHYHPFQNADYRQEHQRVHYVESAVRDSYMHHNGIL